MLLLEPMKSSSRLYRTLAQSFFADLETLGDAATNPVQLALDKYKILTCFYVRESVFKVHGSSMIVKHVMMLLAASDAVMIHWWQPL